MKKSILWISLLSISVISCQKNGRDDMNTLSAVIVEKEVDAKLVNGHLAFNAGSDYEKFLTISPDEKKSLIKDWARGTTFISFKDGKLRSSTEVKGIARLLGNCEVPDSLIENNEAFFETLDKDGVVQIGTTLYRYDYCSDKVFVISETDASNREYYTDFLNGMERYNIVGAFPTYVDVIEAVAEGYKTMPDTNTVEGNEVFERSGLFGTVAKENFFIHNDPENAQAVQKMDGKIAYDKFGIYFHFYGKEKYQEPCFFNWCTSSNGLRDWNVYYQYRCRRKGKSYDYTGSGIVYPPGSGENKCDKTFYDGSRGLRNGWAQWDVRNVYTNSVKIDRNWGSSWFNNIILYSFQVSPYFRYTNNYTMPSGGVNHFATNF